MGSSGFEGFVREFINSFKPSVDGMIYMWLILVLGIWGFGYAIERSYFIMVRSNIDADKFMAEIRKLVAA